MKTVKELEEYAHKHDVPIMQGEGMEYLLDFLKRQSLHHVLEIGSAIGYSAIRMALLNEDMHILTLERDDERYQVAAENIRDFHLEKRIDIRLCDALEFDTNESFDFIFIDAAKAQYTRFFERYAKNLKEGGFILSDNLDFHGYVDHPEEVTSRNLRQLVRKIRSYIDFLETNENFETTFIKLGDGIAVSRKKSEK